MLGSLDHQIQTSRLTKIYCRDRVLVIDIKSSHSSLGLVEDSHDMLLLYI